MEAEIERTAMDSRLREFKGALVSAKRMAKAARHRNRKMKAEVLSCEAERKRIK